ncbi:hypothetical protein ACSQYD_001892 [Listeria monocytogenes]
MIAFAVLIVTIMNSKNKNHS